MSISLQEVQFRMSREVFTCQTTKDGWEIEYEGIQQDSRIIKGNLHTETISFSIIPKNSDSEFVFGYAKCLAIERGWLTA